jgi:hypothetical protein
MEFNCLECDEMAEEIPQNYKDLLQRYISVMDEFPENLGPMRSEVNCSYDDWYRAAASVGVCIGWSVTLHGALCQDIDMS